MSKSIKLLHPELQEIIPKFLKECKRQGLIVKILDTLRNKKEQDDLYAQGRTKPGKIVTFVKYPYSNHNWGIAFDFCRNDGKGAFDDSDNWFYKVGQIAKNFGLSWGGDWAKKDKPHIEMTKYGMADYLYKRYKTLDNFKKTWEYKEIFTFIERKYEYNNITKVYEVITKDGENYIKVRDLASLLNKKVYYDKNTKITLLKDEIEKKDIVVNNKKEEIHAINYDGFNYMNAREIGNALGYYVYYDKDSKKIFFYIKE